MTRAPRVIVCSHLGRPKGAPDPKYTLAPVAARLGELLGTPVVFADGHRRRVRAGRRRGPARRPGPAAGEPALQRGRDQQGRRRARRVRRPARRVRRRLRRRRVRRGAPQARLACTTSPARLPHYAGGLVLTRGRGAASKVSDDARAAVRGGARRLEGLRQARRHPGAAAQGRPAAGRRRHVLHLPQGPGPRGRQVAARGRHGRHLRDLLAQADGRIVLPVDVVAATAFAADADARRRRRSTRSRPTGSGLDIGPETVALFAEAIGSAQDGVLERADGRVRAGAVRRGHPRGGRGDHQDRRLLGGRRRRLGRGRAHARPRRVGVRPHLDRRRRVAGVPRGQDPARHRRHWRTDD